MVMSVYPVIRQYGVRKIEIRRPGHHHVEVPVVKSQSVRNGQGGLPELAPGNGGRRADAIVFEQSQELVPLEIAPRMNRIAMLYSNAAALVDERRISIH